MTLEQAAEGSEHTVEIGGKAVKFRKLDMKDFATLTAKCGNPKATFFEVIDWCESAAGALAVLELAASKVDPTISETAINQMGTPAELMRAVIRVVNLSNGVEKEEASNEKK